VIVSIPIFSAAKSTLCRRWSIPSRSPFQGFVATERSTCFSPAAGGAPPSGGARRRAARRGRVFRFIGDSFEPRRYRDRQSPWIVPARLL